MRILVNWREVLAGVLIILLGFALVAVVLS
jgi:hypothetical protein